MESETGFEDKVKNCLESANSGSVTAPAVRWSIIGLLSLGMIIAYASRSNISVALSIPAFVKSFQLLQNYHENWKETGPVPADKKEEIWQRFSSATEKINQRRQDFYVKLKEEQENNYITKNPPPSLFHQFLLPPMHFIKLKYINKKPSSLNSRVLIIISKDMVSKYKLFFF